MRKTTCSTIIQRPLEEVYDFMVNLDVNEAKWQDGVREIKLVDERPIQAGTRFLEERGGFGWHWAMLFEFSEYHPNQSYSMQTLETLIPHVGHRVFEAVDGGTRVTENTEFQFSSILGKLFEPIIAFVMLKQTQKAYGKLKSILEAT